MENTYNNLIKELFKALEETMGTVELLDDNVLNADNQALWETLKLKREQLNEIMDEEKRNIGIALEEVKVYLCDQLDAEDEEAPSQTQDMLDNTTKVEDRIMNNVFDVKNREKERIMADEESTHFRVVLRVEQLDGDGNCIDVGSEHVLADYENDDDGTSVGQLSDDYYNKVVNNCVRGRL